MNCSFAIVRSALTAIAGKLGTRSLVLAASLLLLAVFLPATIAGLGTISSKARNNSRTQLASATLSSSKNAM